MPRPFTVEDFAHRMARATEAATLAGLSGLVITPGPDLVHEIVRRAQQAPFEAVRPGVACQEIDRVARVVITEAGYGEYFIHRTGHGIGLTTHEPPYMVEGEQQLLVPGGGLLPAVHPPAGPARTVLTCNATRSI